MIFFRRRIEVKKANEIQSMYNRNLVKVGAETGVGDPIEFDFLIITPSDSEACRDITDKIISKDEAY